MLLIKNPQFLPFLQAWVDINCLRTALRPYLSKNSRDYLDEVNFPNLKNVVNDRNGISPKPKYGFFTEPEPKLNTETIL